MVALDLYLDAVTHLLFALKKTTFDAKAYQNRAQLELQFFDYGFVSGVAVPYRIQRLVNGSSADVAIR